jgi:translation initiation factor 4G
MRMPSGPLPALHKTGSAYKMGGTVTDDPEEEKAQKSLKSMLNKITPQNFEKITEQARSIASLCMHWGIGLRVLLVSKVRGASQIIAKITERKKAQTLSGFIDQIFDKALAETTFAELYADLVAK